jgi:8-oxo-dGTP pyrophosphatase MutT (NUDIX family)
MIRDCLRAARRFDSAAHVPLFCAGAHIGWLRHAAAQRLVAWPEIFKRDAAGVRIADLLESPAARTGAVDGVVNALHEEGAIRGWRNERYAVVSGFHNPPLFHIERAAARYLGTTTYAAHVNGYCGSGVDCEMWLARRSASKPIDPGMLDNLVGGGMSAGIPPSETIVREAWEEAGIPAQLARLAVAAGTVRLLRQVPEGVQSEVIFVHDLALPRDFQPRNQDGEVAELRRVPIADVVEIVNGCAGVTLDASLVMLSFLVRRSYVGIEDATGVLELDL